jgi:hypothetical protein
MKTTGKSETAARTTTSRSGRASRSSTGALVELGEPALADADDEHLRPHPDEVDRSPRIEGQVTAELDRPARPPHAEPSCAPQDHERERAHGHEGDERLDEIGFHSPPGAPLYHPFGVARLHRRASPALTPRSLGC